jgi:hypothetical protein
VTSEFKIPSGVYLAPPDVQSLRDAAKKAGLTWFDLNLAGIEHKREFLKVCAKGLRFPRWFGGNWDAFPPPHKDLYADCVVYCRNSGQFAEAAPDDYATALEILQDASIFWKERGSTFAALVDAEPEGVSLAQLPAPKKGN